jgi:acyl-coenzyme A synthetase/AMP-(fatty) acid ligase
MARAEARSLRHYIADTGPEQFFFDRGACIRVADLVRGTSLGGRIAELAGRSVAIAAKSQLSSALALIELDGVARRLLILPPDVDAAHLDALMETAGIDAVVTDDGLAEAFFNIAVRVEAAHDIVQTTAAAPPLNRTEWVLLTSGTTGVPKMVVHTVDGLSAAIARRPDGGPIVWGTFYDIRRYGGLQIFLRAVLGGASLVLSSAGEPTADHLDRLGLCGVTHLSGTPSHWRRALMSPSIRSISPAYVRLSGEIADQAILDSLRAAFPRAGVGHAYASTEAGVGFHVNDGLAGFPAALIGPAANGVEIRVVDGSLRIRSPGSAARYVGPAQAAVADDEGFVDTGDMVERRGDRFHFVGRRGGIINIGGLKVHPEEVEAVINRHPQVRMSLVRSRKSPITGAIVVADVVLSAPCQRGDAEGAIKHDILKLCRGALPDHKVPAIISFVPALAVAASGKLARSAG